MKRKIDDFVEHGGNGLMVVRMSVRNRSRCRSHFYLYGAACNDPFAGLQTFDNRNFAAIAVAIFTSRR